MIHINIFVQIPKRICQYILQEKNVLKNSKPVPLTGGLWQIHSLLHNNSRQTLNNKCKKVRKEIAFEGEKMFGEKYLVET